MQVDVMKLSGLIETAEGNKPVGQEPTATGEEAVAAMAPDLFAGLLAALTPLKDSLSTEGSSGDEVQGKQEQPPAEKPTPGIGLGRPTLAANSLNMETAGNLETPGVVAAATIGEAGGPIEVLRSPGGLPLTPPTPAAVETETDAKILLTSTDEKPALQPWGGRLATLVPAGPRPVVEPETTGNRSEAKPAPATDTTATPTRPDGRPVPVTPSLAATSSARIPVAPAPVPKPGPEPEIVSDPPVEDTAPDGPGVAAAAADAAETRASDRLQPPPRPELAAIKTADAASGASATPGEAEVAPATPTVAMPVVADPTTIAHRPGDTMPTVTDSRPAVDPERIQAQVVKQMLGRVDNSGSGEQKLTLQLDPEHLGKIEVKLVASGSRLEVIFSAETAEAQHALRAGSQDLARSLGLHAGRWQQVEIRIAEPEGAARSSANQDDRDDQDDPQEERSEHGSPREREDHQRRHHGDER